MSKVIYIFIILIFFESCTPKIYIEDVEWCLNISESDLRPIYVKNDTIFACTYHRINTGTREEKVYNYWDAYAISKTGKLINKLIKVPRDTSLGNNSYYHGNDEIVGLEGYKIGQNFVKSKFIVEELYVTSKQSFMPIRFGGYSIYYVIIKYNDKYCVFELDNTNFTFIENVTLFGNKYLILNFYDASTPIFEHNKICMLDLEKIIKKYID